MNPPDGLAPRQPAGGQTGTWRQQVLYDCCLALIVIGVLTVSLGPVQVSQALLIVGVLLIGSGIEGIAWEMAHRGPRRSSPRDE
jgi:hypothetical protein